MKRLIILITALLLVCNIASAKPPTSGPDKIIVSGFVIIPPDVNGVAVIYTVPSGYTFIMTDIVAKSGKDYRFFEGAHIPDSTENLKVSVNLEETPIGHPAPLSIHFQSGIPFAAGDVIVKSSNHGKEVTISGYLIPE
jgi:hypothetical protein